MKKIYTTYIQSKLEYISTVLFSNLRKNKTVEKGSTECIGMVPEIRGKEDLRRHDIQLYFLEGNSDVNIDQFCEIKRHTKTRRHNRKPCKERVRRDVSNNTFPATEYCSRHVEQAKQ